MRKESGKKGEVRKKGVRVERDKKTGNKREERRIKYEDWNWKENRKKQGKG